MTAPKSKLRTPILVLIVAGLLLGGIVLYKSVFKPVSVEKLLSAARAALRTQDWDAAIQAADQVPETAEEHSEAQLIAGEALSRRGDLKLAIERYESIPQDKSKQSVAALAALADCYFHNGQLQQSEQAMQQLLTHADHEVFAHERLALLLSATGRPWEAREHHEFLLWHGQVDLLGMTIMADVERSAEVDELLDRGKETAPDDPVRLLGQAVRFAAEGNPEEALKNTTKAINSYRDSSAVHALHGEYLSTCGHAEVSRWNSTLPAGAETDAGVWYVRGLIARGVGNLQGAARCFWEALRLQPTHRRACSQLSQVLSAMEHPAAPAFSERSALMMELGRNLDVVLRHSFKDPKSAQRTIEVLEALGRYPEAVIWASQAADQFGGQAWAIEAFERLRNRVTRETPFCSPEADLTAAFDLSVYEVPDFDVGAGVAAADQNSLESRIAFQLQSDIGLGFAYENGADPSTKGARMFESNGGGVGVIDLDLDGQPDLYFPQGRKWKQGDPPPSTAEGLSDALFRLVNGVYQDVLPVTGIIDLEFGQGCSVGDVNNDGFPDLYIANIGPNRLWLNNGDGTFTRGPDSEQDSWTSSCLITDLNGDGNPDLFDVNYVQGKEVWTAICQGYACSPSVFEGSPDLARVSSGDGRFTDLPKITPAEESKGLGVVAAVVGDSALPSLFIANDQVANFLLAAQPSDPTKITLESQGLATGVAFNDNGLAMGCMGIAADDIDGNGLIDFFVTNFHNEPNTLYVQDAPGLFMDRTAVFNLKASGMPYVGWGTQFLDADLDGYPDLVAVNGHVDDYRDEGGEYHMKPLLYHNQQGRRFQQLDASMAGDFFGEKRLGRGLARLDWNGDGRMDFVVSNIGDTATLLTNQTPDVGGYLNVRLIGSRSPRDAIGTRIKVTAGEMTQERQLTSGDGFMASNQRQVQFGMADRAVAESIKVMWPSGGTTELSNVPTDSTLIVVEGDRRAVVTDQNGDRLIDTQ